MVKLFAQITITIAVAIKNSAKITGFPHTSHSKEKWKYFPTKNAAKNTNTTLQLFKYTYLNAAVDGDVISASCIAEYIPKSFTMIGITY